MKVKVVYVDEDKPEEWAEILNKENLDVEFFVDGQEIYYFIDIEQMPTTKDTLITSFDIGFCIVKQIYYDLTGKREHEIYIEEK